MNKFEQLIEYVINDEEKKARDLFHEIVVEKSRTIYEELMTKEEIDEAKDKVDEEEKVDEAKGNDKDKEEKVDEAKDEDLDENVKPIDEMGGDKADGLIDDIETEEKGLNLEDEDMGDAEMGDAEMGDVDVKDEADLEDRVVDLEDKLDELMAEFESLMGDEHMSDEVADADAAADVAADDMSGDEAAPGDEKEAVAGLDEAVNLKPAPAAVKSEESNINKKSAVPANSGAKGMDAKPVKSNGGDEKGRPAPTAKPLMSDAQNTPGQKTVKLTPAPKPELKQATGVNTKSPV